MRVSWNETWVRKKGVLVGWQSCYAPIFCFFAFGGMVEWESSGEKGMNKEDGGRQAGRLKKVTVFFFLSFSVACKTKTISTRDCYYAAKMKSAYVA